MSGHQRIQDIIVITRYYRSTNRTTVESRMVLARITLDPEECDHLIARALSNKGRKSVLGYGMVTTEILEIGDLKK